MMTLYFNYNKVKIIFKELNNMAIIKFKITNCLIFTNISVYFAYSP